MKDEQQSQGFKPLNRDLTKEEVDAFMEAYRKSSSENPPLTEEDWRQIENGEVLVPSKDRTRWVKLSDTFDESIEKGLLFGLWGVQP